MLLTDLAGEDRAEVEAILADHGVPLAEQLSPVARNAMACPALPTCGQALGESERVLPALALPSLTREIDDKRSPVRQFLDQFTAGLKDVQRRYRQDAPPLAVAPVDKRDANPATLGTAADWLLRFLVHPSPDLQLPMVGVAQEVGGRLLSPLVDLARLLGISPDRWLPHIKAWRSDPFDQLDVAWEVELPELERHFHPDAPVEVAFTGPVAGSTVDQDPVARGCWALALATELFRAGPMALDGPLGHLPYPTTVDNLLDLAPPAAISQLSKLRVVFETVLLPELAPRHGAWVLGPTFAGSRLMAADADLVAAGLLLELKTYKTLSLGLHDVLQVVGYALLDFDDEYRIDTLGLFNARYAKLATWRLYDLLHELAGYSVDVPKVRDDFRRLLEQHSDTDKERSFTSYKDACLGPSGPIPLASDTLGLCNAIIVRRGGLSHMKVANNSYSVVPRGKGATQRRACHQAHWLVTLIYSVRGSGPSGTSSTWRILGSGQRRRRAYL